MFSLTQSGIIKLFFLPLGIPIFKTEEFGYISDLYVKKGFRKMKLSSKLYAESKEMVQEKGMKYISIAMYPDNKSAHSIYKHWGFFDYHLDMRRKL